MSDFMFYVESPQYAISTDEIWPDGDAPENPTLEDVIAVVREESSLWVLMSDWGLLDDLKLYIDGNEVTE